MQQRLARAMFRSLSPAGRRGRLSIFIFHRVLREHDPLQPDEPTATEFERRMKWLKSWFNVLPLERAVRLLDEGGLPERAAAITFDDGYADNFEVALPVLERVGLPATFFIATGYLDGGRMFNDSVIEAIRGARVPELDLQDLQLGKHSLEGNTRKREAIAAVLDRVKYVAMSQRALLSEAVAERAAAKLPDNLMMTRTQVARLRGTGVTVGCHTVTHPILAEVDIQEARDEIATSRVELERLAERAITVFAYPNGKPHRDYAAVHVDLVRAMGFTAAVSTAWGAARSGDDLFQLPRFTPWDRTAPGFAMRIAGNLLRGGSEIV